VPDPLHASVVHERLSVAHAEPLERFDHADVLDADWHDWQSLAGFLVPSVRQTLAIRQLLAWSVCLQAPAPSHVSLVQESPSVVQLVPLLKLVQPFGFTLGWHDWHSLPGLSVPLL
jgi:hypothetical protein